MMNMGEWLDPHFLEEPIQWLNEDVLQIFGMEPEYIQFFLVFAFMGSVMWVVKPVVEWLVLRNWLTFLSCLSSVLLVLVFLQMVDRYAMAGTTSTLPEYYWFICLSAISGYGLTLAGWLTVKQAYRRFTKRKRRKAA
ncbi:hypothetical protein GLW03_14680 [Halobacillus halophilus]|nr:MULTISPECIES: hypothetical protein [Halobacillus]MCA1023464.1 hypothetical protein [Halobacillus litoralis]MYL31061.1 hypothetical protein [Halobacillus halophilus]